MREMIFNDLSVHLPVSSIHELRPLLADVARGMAGLVAARLVDPTLRMTKHWSEYQCAKDGSLWDLLLLMQRERREPEETRFLMRLSMKAPLLQDLPAGVTGRFLGCEPAIDGGAGGECLVLCAHVFGIAISLPVQAGSDCDQLVVRFRELSTDLEMADVEETIDNLARERYAAIIIERHRRRNLAQDLNFGDLWSQRASLFPYLAFGLDVEEHLQRLNPTLIDLVVKRLDELNEAAEEWLLNKAAAPNWRSKVTPENVSLICNNELRNSRVFRNAEGEPAPFEWHARMGNSYRIHLRFDRAVLSIEIGYIGPHLPLA
jgi:hypothetical protein